MSRPSAIARSSARNGAAGVAALAKRARALQGRPPARPAPWDADALDDLAFHRPWNLAVKAARIRARRNIDNLQHGETIIIVNWNTKDVLRDTIAAVRDLTPGHVPITVVDNGSTDGSRQWLETQNVDLLALPMNVGHSIALDLAFLGCETDIAITLDSDCVPISTDWFASLVEPVRSGEAVLAGARSKRNFVHPMAMAVDMHRFITDGLTFQVFKMPGLDREDEVWGETAFDTAEWMSRMVHPDELHFLETTPNPVEGLPGMTSGGVVYHHGGVTRAAGGGMDPNSYAQWRHALDQLLPE